MFLHNGNYVATNTFHDSDCKKEFVYVEGLLDGMSLMSEQPFLIQRDDGVLVSVDQSFASLTLKDKHDEPIKTIELEFITDCSLNNDPLSQPFNNPSYHSNRQNNGLLLLTLLVAIMLSLILFKSLRNQN